MEAFHGSSSANSLRMAKSFTWCSNSSSCQWRSTSGGSGGVSVFFLKLPSFRAQADSGSRRLRISSRLGRQAKRRNSLREKLLGRQDQVRKVLEGTAPHLPPENVEHGLNLHTQREPFEGSTGAVDASTVRGGSSLAFDQDVEKDVQTGDSLQREELGGESVLWNKLEGWVEQYKKDSELWGVGSVPVFTIYKDTDGNVIRVSLNEEEIVRRSRVETWSSQPKEFGDESMDVNAKISRAKIIAKEIESGEYKLPKNSTIAKIVTEGRNSSSFSIDRFRPLNLGDKTLLKHSPKMVVGVFLGCFVFLALKKLFTDVRKELTREEKEILRRKMKVRMERRTVEKGSTEILNNIPELPKRTVERPPLDRDELMKTIKAKASTQGSMESSLGGHLKVVDEKFQDRVREIRKMVKQVHELEQGVQQHVDKSSEQANVPTAKNELLAMSSDVNLETHAITNGSDYRNILDDSVLEVNTEALNFSGAMENTTVGSPSNTVHIEIEETISTDEVRDSEMFASSLVGTLGCANEMPTKVSAGHVNSENGSMVSDMDLIKNEEVERGSNKGEDAESGISQNGGVQCDPTCSENPSSVHKNSNGMKPKIIVSVKEAREYLNQRCASSTGKLQSKPDISPNSTNGKRKIAKPPKDNNLAQESCSHMVLDHVPKATDQGNIIHPSWTAAEAARSSAGVETGETGCWHGTSLECTDDNILGKEVIALSSQAFKKEQEAIPKEADGARNLYKPYSRDVTYDECHHQQSQVKSSEIFNDISDITVKELKQKNGTADEKDKILAVSSLESTSVPTSMVRLSTEREMKGDNDDADCEILRKADKSLNLSPSATCDEASAQGDCLETKHDTHSSSDSCADISLESTDSNGNKEVKSVQGGNSWIEKNFHQFDPIIKKIGDGFQENYMAAREKVQEEKMLRAEMAEMALEDEELEWMNDGNLRDIVFKVRDNELAGRDPFHLMDADEQSAFFQGLERKAEKQSKKLLALHELIHSKIENIDYGMDGISLNDPLEKIVPRWKGLPISEDPEFLNHFGRGKQVIFESKVETPHAATDNTDDTLQKSDKTSHSDVLTPSSAINNLNRPSLVSDPANPKTVIEGSDGSRKAGIKLGKEHWEHTKKWSREFLELYNAETDPEIKSIMRDMGKDLDKWITDKEIKDVADLMTRIPKRKRRYIEKRLDKLKREIEMFGHQAVASKYREYSEEKEEDYLWWLDLKFILCIELYRTEDNVPKIGFYSLEMAADLELNPKQNHVIAFEDPGDSKNFCYIIQTHMEMLGNGSAFVVARPPKDAFREAKANGFNVTVIRKGELKLNIDLTLEEVEEEIIEIGSKMYHDKIMHERSINMGGLMKGVFSADKSTKRKPKRVLKKPTLQ